MARGGKNKTKANKANSVQDTESKSTQNSPKSTNTNTEISPESTTGSVTTTVEVEQKTSNQFEVKSVQDPSCFHDVPNDPNSAVESDDENQLVRHQQLKKYCILQFV